MIDKASTNAPRIKVDHTLPIFEYKDKILESLTKHQTTIVVGETGCGKTTQLAQFIIDDWKGVNAKEQRVAVSNPRRVGAVSVARRVAQERGVELGAEVGYSVRFSDQTSARTVIKYITDGCLLRECVRDPLLSQYTVVVLDEAHERSINTDILIGLLKLTLAKRPDLRLIITSATLDITKFKNFFDDCNALEVPGRLYPVEIKYFDPIHSIATNAQSLNVAPAVDIAMKIHLFEPAGDVLVFMTGQEDITKACELLDRQLDLYHEENPSTPIGQIAILGLYAALPPDEQIAVFAKAPDGVRKVIFATNIAETSLTIDGIVYVVDPGYVKQKIHVSGLDGLKIVPISKTAATQRAGRAGRTKPGKCFRLYSRLLYDDMEPDTVPEIQRTNLQSTILYLKVLGIADVGSFKFLDPPDDTLIAEALKQLHGLGALDAAGQVTKHGLDYAALPIDPTLAAAAVEGKAQGVERETAVIVAMLTQENIFYGPRRGARGEQDNSELVAKAAARYGPGDHFFLLYLFDRWVANGRSRDWCQRHGVSATAMRNAEQVSQQLLEILRGLDVRRRASPRSASAGTARTTRARVTAALCAGFFMNTARQALDNAFFFVRNEHTQPPVFVHPSSTLVVSAQRDIGWVLYHSLSWTSKGFLRYVTPVGWEDIEAYYAHRECKDIKLLLGDELFRRLYPEKAQPVKTASRVAAEVKRLDEQAVSDAKARYLERKRKREEEEKAAAAKKKK